MFYRLVEYQATFTYEQKQIWKDSGSGADDEGSFWRVPPVDGYYPLGDAVCRGWWDNCEEIIRVKDVSSERNLLVKVGFPNVIHLM